MILLMLTIGSFAKFGFYLDFISSLIASFLPRSISSCYQKFIRDIYVSSNICTIMSFLLMHWETNRNKSINIPFVQWNILETEIRAIKKQSPLCCIIWATTKSLISLGFIHQNYVPHVEIRDYSKKLDASHFYRSCFIFM